MTNPLSSNRVYIIAEAGSNWRQGTPQRDLAMAKELIDAAVEAEADAIKFQTFRAETVYSARAGMVGYLRDSCPQEDIHSIFRDLAMPYEMIPELAAYCQKKGIQFLSSPFSNKDFEAVDPYVSMHKIASYEISHLRLIELAAASGKPVLLSTGASVEDDIAWAVDHFYGCGGTQLVLMQCTLNYPTPPNEVNLRVLTWLKARFGCVVGLSDHTRDPRVAPVAATALGARVIEKHFTLHNRLPGPDHNWVITAEELKELVRLVRTAEQMVGTSHKCVTPSEQEMFDFGRRRVQAVRDIRAGEPFREGENVDILRPGNQKKGVHPRYLTVLAGQKAKRDIALGEGVQEGDW